MATNRRLMWNYLDTGTTVMTGIAKGTTTGGPTLDLRLVKAGLSALVALDAETATLTLEAFWEVSNDAVTWYEVPPYNNAAFVVWATGTGGADPTITKVLPAPEAVQSGVRYARCSVRNLVADGLIADTYRIGYNFEKDDYVA